MIYLIFGLHFCHLGLREAHESHGDAAPVSSPDCSGSPAVCGKIAWERFRSTVTP